ncbi:MAG: hypothetical protein ABJC04_04410 [Verrucomicrobiota bacterium]
MWKDKLSPPIQNILDLHDENNPAAFLGSKEMWQILGAMVILAGLTFLWAAYLRRPKRRSKSLSGGTAQPLLRDSRDGKKRSRKKRWKRRNPTLSETGGLPPRKLEDPSAQS